MSDKSITITIANRPYNLKVKTHEEETVRLAAVQIEKQIQDFSLKFAHADKQDILAMVLLEMKALQLRNEKEHSQEDTNIKERLIQIDQLLNTTLYS